MRIDWMYHTGFVVSDMDRSLAFYRDLLGLEEERNSIVEDEFIGQLLGYPGVRIHTAYLGIGDTRHSLELVQFLDLQGGQVSPVALNNVGAAHLGFLVDDVGLLVQQSSGEGSQVCQSTCRPTRCPIPVGPEGVLRTRPGWQLVGVCREVARLLVRARLLESTETEIGRTGLVTPQETPAPDAGIRPPGVGRKRADGGVSRPTTVPAERLPRMDQ